LSDHLHFLTSLAIFPANQRALAMMKIHTNTAMSKYSLIWVNPIQNNQQADTENGS
jgi:hypothetical protein